MVVAAAAVATVVNEPVSCSVNQVCTNQLQAVDTVVIVKEVAVVMVRRSDCP